MLSSFGVDGHVRRRLEEIFSGFAGASILAVREELAAPVLSVEAERQRLRDPRGFIGPLATTAASAIGIFYLTRCVGIARLQHQPLSTKSRVFGALVAVSYFVTAGCSTAYCRYAEVLDATMCPQVDTAFAAQLRSRCLKNTKDGADFVRHWRPWQLRVALTNPDHVMPGVRPEEDNGQLKLL
eukprot:gnl/TRDRNA2_/TRDRNA2_59821_c0_seq2.p1 gnl/TRDRNA2_/TRDRNA2_59821_c0~~gnl/TRDRNA2_/TRDRNA2_59821_c0_seq2.p1  ORF type:complete len:183 (+),score=31.33 gnl/TRDRNA2_/TRDRNA2_59821_c0_seq2:115-663(+)